MTVAIMHTKRFGCDLCGKTIDTLSYDEEHMPWDVPDGWEHFIENGEHRVQHACPNCAHWIVDGQRSKEYFADKIRRLKGIHGE